MIGVLFWGAVAIWAFLNGVIWLAAIAVMGLIYGLFMHRPEEF
jgi:hypothetical protein